MSKSVFEGFSYIYTCADAIAPWHEDEKRREKKLSQPAAACMCYLYISRANAEMTKILSSKAAIAVLVPACLFDASVTKLIL